jgi:hypothetical protein
MLVLGAFVCALSVSAFGATNEIAEVLPPCCRPIAAQTNYTDKSLFLLDSTWTSDAGRKVKLGVIYRQDAKGDFAHSNVITVLNAEGEIVFQQPGVNVPPDKIVQTLEKLVK